MNGKSMHWVNHLAALGLVVGLVAGLAAVGNAQSVGGQAYSTYVNTPLGYSGQSPLAVLPAVSGTDGATADAEGSALNVAGALSSDFLNSITSGEIGTAETGAQSTASAASVVRSAAPTARRSRTWRSPVWGRSRATRPSRPT